MSKGKNTFSEGDLLFDPTIGLKNGPYRKAKAYNQAIFTDYFMRLSNLAMSMFKWENLPDSCNERFLEWSLYWHGDAIFVERPSNGDIVNMLVTPNGAPTIYNDYSSYIAYTNAAGIDVQDNQIKVSNENSVYVRNNYMRFPTAYTLRLYAQRFMEINVSADVNIKSQKTPIVILTDEKSRLTWQNFFEKYEGNEPLIIADQSLNIDNFKQLQTAGPFIANDLMLYSHNLWNEVMTFIGIMNTNTDKRERMTDDEATISQDMVNQAVMTMQLPRQEACDKMNTIWKNKLDKGPVSVHLRNKDWLPSFSDELIDDTNSILYYNRGNTSSTSDARRKEGND